MEQRYKQPHEIKAAIFEEARCRWPESRTFRLTEVARLAGFEKHTIFSTAIHNPRDRRSKILTARFLNTEPKNLWPDMDWSRPLHRHSNKRKVTQISRNGHCQKRVAA
mgnify:CR=1 FL=1